MRRVIRTAVLWLVGGAVLAASPAWAKNEGQEDLDKATEAKLTVKTVTDLAEVIRLCDSAIKKGLDEDNTVFAKRLLASSLIQRGEFITKSIFDTNASPDAHWPQYRRLALEDLERAVKLDPSQPEAYYRIAQLNLLPGGKEKRVQEAIAEAVKLSPKDGPLRARIFTFRSTLEKDPKQRLADLEEAVRAAPNDLNALRARAMAYADLDKLEQALADLDAALKLDSDHAPTYEAKAMILARLKRYDEAVAAADQARQVDPKALAPLVQRARVQAMRSDLKAALKDLNEAAKMDPNNPAILLLRASVHHELKEHDKALADINKVLELKPGFDMAIRLRAGVLAGTHQLKGAIADMETLLKAAPDDMDLRSQLAVLYMAAREHQKAIDLFSEVIKKDPKEGTAWRGRADTLLGIGKHAEAIADYEQAVKLLPSDSGILNNYSWVLSTTPVDKLRNGKRALELALDACRVTEYKQPHILSTLAAAYAEMGDFKTAMEWSQKAVNLAKPETKMGKALAKELESYRAGKPIREQKTGNEPEDDDDSDSAASPATPAKDNAKDKKPAKPAKK